MTKPTSLRIELSASAKCQLERASKKYDQTQFALFSRLSEWFASQDPEIQAVILGHIPDAIAGDVARLILDRMATQRRSADVCTNQTAC